MMNEITERTVNAVQEPEPDNGRGTMSDSTKSKGAQMAPAAGWAGFQPPPLPEADKLRSAVEAARKLTPREVMQVSISAGIHNADGTLTDKYR